MMTKSNLIDVIDEHIFHAKSTHIFNIYVTALGYLLLPGNNLANLPG